MKENNLPFKSKLILLSFLLLCVLSTLAQTDTTYTKEGFTFGLLPAISYDADLGFQYGGLTNLYWYGDGSRYPEYEHSLYLEVSKYTAGSTLLRGYFDSPIAINNVRTTVDVTYFRDQTMDFYGFNGYQAVYNANWEDDSSEDYLSRVFYRHHRDMFRVLTNFKGHLGTDNSPWEWMGGLTFFNFNIKSVDINRINKKLDENDQLPDIPTLYDKYVDWGIIKEKEAKGGNHLYVKGGLSYDTRDILANPSKGMWTELFLIYMPSLFSSFDDSYIRMNLFHRQYFSLTPKRNLIFAYRVGLQHKIAGDIPFYLLPHMASSVLTSATSQGLGGSKTLRGINRNRVVGDGNLLANVELRWKMWRTKLFKQDFYLGSNYFVDMGMITQKYQFDLTPAQDELRDHYPLFFNNEDDKLHLSYGFGLKGALNENFVLSAEYGFAADKQDGTSGLYITLNYLF
ncbi:Omp85 family outer membrane protein [Carboxylicivirga linearis]|uniref:BamA/TamA family outer membrane protein n=1 Tax=Carboxylicivirga linearis TaxID=1628157 RepID=A0ABS5K099_9BACT|nr:BamA/TamA family outer membrane protein [Carboxylicivirga linearis]MBS2100538.1 BamA/TamA family outer membrane protein [Carboxylicivirga linearis]